MKNITITPIVLYVNSDLLKSKILKKNK